MNYFLIYTYTTGAYQLIEENQLAAHDEHEMLFEFGESELIIAKKVLANLQRERSVKAAQECAA